MNGNGDTLREQRMNVDMRHEPGTAANEMCDRFSIPNLKLTKLFTFALSIIRK